NTPSAVSHSPAGWVAVGEGGVAFSSADGFTWTSRTSGSASALTDVVWTGSQFLPVGQGGAVTPSPHRRLRWGRPLAVARGAHHLPLLRLAERAPHDARRHHLDPAPPRDLPL